jgi:hypothetical protein
MSVRKLIGVMIDDARLSRSGYSSSVRSVN